MTEQDYHILIVDDDPDILTTARLLLKRSVATVDTEIHPENIPDLLRQKHYHVILLDMNFTRDVTSGREGFNWLARIMEIDPDAVVIMITAYGDVEKAVKSMRSGAFDFILKPWQNEKLLATVNAAIQLSLSRNEVSLLKSRQSSLSADMDEPFHEMIGSSPAMEIIFKAIAKVAATDANVLILGENGTGKELVARALHRQSLRAGEAFVSVDMGALSETLFESELFGYKKGAFTDAKEDRAGRFEIATQGTLFLDEIGNLPRPLQAKLLTVLEQREVTRLGSNIATPIDIRLICASNLPLQSLVLDGSFRQDLYYRVNTVEIILPPLSDRDGDIELLQKFFLAKFSKKYNREIIGLHPAALDKLIQYSWPGNVRELKHTVERAVILGESPTLQPSDFPLPMQLSAAKNEASDPDRLENLERSAVSRVLKRHQGNITLAARELGIARTSLYRKMKKYDL